MDEDLRREQIDLAEDPGPVRRGVDDHDVLRRGAPERDLGRREVLGAPVPAPVVGLADVAGFRNEREQLVGGRRSEDLARLERQLERRAPEVGDQDVEVVRVQPGLLRPTVEQEVRVVDDVPINGGAGRHQDGDGRLGASAGATDLLPRGGDRAGIAGEDRDVEPPDVDSELQGVRRDDPEDLALTESTLDGPPLERQVTAAVATNARPRTEVLAERLAQRRQHDLDGGPAPSEHDRLATRSKERQRPPMGDRHRRASGARRPIGERRFDEQDVALATRRAVLVDQYRRPTRQGRRELRRVRDRRRAAHDHRTAAVVRA